VNTDVSFLQTAASLVLVVLVLAVSRWQKLGLEKSVIWAVVRATVQLIAVGLIFTVIFESTRADLWAWLWVLLMVIVSATVTARRAAEIPGVAVSSLAAIATTVGIVLLVVFGLGILDAEPVAIVVISGITIGNTMPSIVQSTVRMQEQLTEQRGQIEAMLSLGFDAASSTRRQSAQATSLTLVPHIERTRVVGIIALPGAMTGLLLAGADPLDAVLIQLVVMLLVLGSVAVSVTIVTLAIARQALTPDLRLADWISR